MPKFRERVIGQYTEVVQNHLLKPHDNLVAEQQQSGSSEVQNLSNRVKEIMAEEETPSFSSNSGTNSPSLTRKTPHQPKMKRVNVVIVTHGGWIQQLMKFLREELKMELCCSDNVGFPRCTGIFRIEISKQYQPAGLDSSSSQDYGFPIVDFEWVGVITHVNHVPHLANLDKKGFSQSSLANIDGRGSSSVNSSMTSLEGALLVNRQLSLKQSGSTGSLRRQLSRKATGSKDSLRATKELEIKEKMRGFD